MRALLSALAVLAWLHVLLLLLAIVAGVVMGLSGGAVRQPGAAVVVGAARS